MTSRRTFVGQAAQLVTGLTGLRVAGGWPGLRRLLSTSNLRGGASAVGLCGDLMRPQDLAALATMALESATRAGASFADIRLAEKYMLHVYAPPDAGGGYAVELTSHISYGIRVIAAGGQALVHGCVLEGDRVAAAAREAVASAKGIAALQTKPVELAPAPVVEGTWTVPIQADPFTVPLQDQADVLNALQRVSDRMLVGALQAEVSAEFEWIKERRVYASTSGSRLEQTFYRSRPVLEPSGGRTYLPDGRAFLAHLGSWTSQGYEWVLDPTLPDQLRAALETAVEISRLPERPLPVGRYPAVFDGGVLGTVFGATVGVGLELDRAAGEESDTTGVSFLGPPAQVLGRQMINPLLNATASRQAPQYEAAKWDDEGVETADYPILKDGIVVDYHTSRATAPLLAEWYRAQGRPVRSHGCGCAFEASDPVTVQMPHVMVAPGAKMASLEDLYSGLRHGLLVTRANGPQGFGLDVNWQLSTGLLALLQVFEVVQGKIVGRVKAAGFPFQTLRLWQGLEALGDDRTVAESAYPLRKGIQWLDTRYTASAPAGLFREMNVSDFGRHR